MVMVNLKHRGYEMWAKVLFFIGLFELLILTISSFKTESTKNSVIAATAITFFAALVAHFIFL